MPTWNPEEYLRFEEDRTRPSRDLAARVCAERVNTIMDLGCGPGNSTAVLAERWPDAAITGLDSSMEMLDHARSTYPQHTWVQGDISEWADTAESYDLVFSNTALHAKPAPCGPVRDPERPRYLLHAVILRQLRRLR